MKILFVNDFFPPFSKGGGEISAFYQLKEVLRNGVEVINLAPKYKDRKKVLKQSFKQYWYNFPLPVKNISPVLFVNPFFTAYLFLNLFFVCKKEKPDLIHCQGKYSAPAVFLISKVLNLPWVLTLRDYKGVCNHGFCLYENVKSCNLLTFFKKDFSVYFKNYIKNKNILIFLIQLFASFLGRINTLFLSFFMKRADRLICVSEFVKRVYAANGYNTKKMEVIYNPSPKIKSGQIKLPENLNKKLSQFKYTVLYAGKLSLGKGADLLLGAGLKLIKRRRDVLFIFCGKINYPIDKLKHQIKEDKQLLFLDTIEQDLLLALMERVDLICLPSVWPEPLSRVTLEAFKLKKPVLSTNVGGQPELVNSKTGWLVKPEIRKLEKSLLLALKSKKELGQKGKNAKILLDTMEKEQTAKLLNLYKSLL